MSPFKSSLAKTAKQLLGLRNTADLGLRGATQNQRTSTPSAAPFTANIVMMGGGGGGGSYQGGGGGGAGGMAIFTFAVTLNTAYPFQVGNLVLDHLHIQVMVMVEYIHSLIPIAVKKQVPVVPVVVYQVIQWEPQELLQLHLEEVVAVLHQMLMLPDQVQLVTVQVQIPLYLVETLVVLLPLLMLVLVVIPAAVAVVWEVMVVMLGHLDGGGDPNGDGGGPGGAGKEAPAPMFPSSFMKGSNFPSTFIGLPVSLPDAGLRTFGGGGGGGAEFGRTGEGYGGSGGGGNGANVNRLDIAATAGVHGRGAGGGGGGQVISPPGGPNVGGDGGGGVIYIQYPENVTATISVPSPRGPLANTYTANTGDTNNYAIITADASSTTAGTITFG